MRHAWVHIFCGVMDNPLNSDQKIVGSNPTVGKNVWCFKFSLALRSSQLNLAPSNEIKHDITTTGVPNALFSLGYGINLAVLISFKNSGWKHCRRLSYILELFTRFFFLISLF